MPAYARALAAALSERDPAHKSDYDQRLRAFLASLQPLEAKIAELRRKYGGIDVTATEPVFGYMAAALGFRMRNERFQLAVMNDAEPRASDVAAFETDLRKHAVRLLFYNSQATDAAAQRLVRIARQSKIPVVGVTETEPPGKTYQDWIMGELDADRSGAVRHPIVSAIEFAGCDAGVRRQDGACRHRPRDPRQRVHRRARAQRIGQDHDDARDTGPAAAAQRRDPRAGQAGGARQSRHRLHAADARRAGSAAALGLGLRRQRRQRPSLGPAAARPRRARRRWRGRSIGCRRQSLHGARWRKPRAASVSACCWRRRCSAARACCCSTSR